MKRKEAIEYLAEAVECASCSDGSITIVSCGGRRIELDTDLVLCCVGMAFLGSKDLLSGELDDVSPQSFVHAVIKAACEAYGHAIGAR